MNSTIFSHRDGAKKIGPSELAELKSIIVDSAPSQPDSKKIRTAIRQQLDDRGWSEPLKISALCNITISSTKNNIGLCLQFGNAGRMYADLLKLQQSFRNRRIKAGCYVVSESDYAKRIGSNIASFDRLVRELEFFESTLSIPLIVFGVWQ